MFVALQTKDRTRVTSIASQWDDRLDVLRDLAKSGRLICPACEQLLWLRVSLKRRRHFAHRHLADCPLANQSAELLEIKAQLFKWLETKYPAQVNLDIPMGVPGRDTLVDLLVEAAPARKFAYWVFDRQQRSRDKLQACRQLPGLHVHFIHTQSTLVQHSDSEILLTASQRDFIVSSDYDNCVGLGTRGHLHFCNGEDSQLSIYRGLHCVHGPNLYAWMALRTGTLSAARISPKTGEIVFDEDVLARDERKRKMRENERRHPAPRSTAPAKSPPPLASHPVEELAPEALPGSTPEPVPAGPNLNGPFRCEDCGIETKDWSVATPLAGTCVCRSCLKKRQRQNLTRRF